MVASITLPSEFTNGVVTPVHQGDCLVGRTSSLIYSTVLGSCVSACVRDSAAGVGGMNHFLLGEQSGSARDRYGASARYGAYAMERLINAVLAQGSGQKAKLEIKIFGGGIINAALNDVGAKNIEFVHEFLFNEGYRSAAEDVGGRYARRVLFKPHSGRVFVRRLESLETTGVVNEELAFAKARLAVRARTQTIELF